MQKLFHTVLSTLAVAFLTACSALQGSLLSGSGQETFTITYEHAGVQETFDVTVTAGEGVVTELMLEPGAEGVERAHQIAFGANLRALVLGQNITDIARPANVGADARSAQLTEVFWEQVMEQLKN